MTQIIMMVRSEERRVGKEPSPRKMKEAKWLSEEASQIAEKRSERQWRKEKIYLTECRV